MSKSKPKKQVIKGNKRRTFSTDAMRDPFTSRGGRKDVTQRLHGNYVMRTCADQLEIYKSNGFAQRAIDAPARDSVREWIDLKVNWDESNGPLGGFDIERYILNRMRELHLQAKLYDFMRFSRVYSKGAFMYWMFKTGRPQGPKEIAQSLNLESIKRIEKLNVVVDSDQVQIYIRNYTRILESSYVEPLFHLNGVKVHNSRISWLCYNFDPILREGISVISQIYDSIIGVDSAQWSASTIMSDLTTKVLKSDLVAGMKPQARAEFTDVLRHLLDSQSAAVLTQDETLERVSNAAGLAGIKEVWQILLDIFSGASSVPQKVLTGNAHGIVTGAEVDTQNYYAGVGQDQEIHLRPIIEKAIRLIIREEEGEIYQRLKPQGIKKLDWEFDFKPLTRLDPATAADVRLKQAQADQIDYNIGKATPAELREEDERYEELESFSENDVIKAGQQTGVPIPPPKTPGQKQIPPVGPVTPPAQPAGGTGGKISSGAPSMDMPRGVVAGI